jgi:hypothetical protein
VPALTQQGASSVRRAFACESGGRAATTSRRRFPPAMSCSVCLQPTAVGLAGARWGSSCSRLPRFASSGPGRPWPAGPNACSSRFRDHEWLADLERRPKGNQTVPTRKRTNGGGRFDAVRSSFCPMKLGLAAAPLVRLFATTRTASWHQFTLVCTRCRPAY